MLKKILGIDKIEANVALLLEITKDRSQSAKDGWVTRDAPFKAKRDKMTQRLMDGT